MPYSEVEAKFLGPGKEQTREPCYKKLKSAADDGVSPFEVVLIFTESKKNPEIIGSRWPPLTSEDVFVLRKTKPVQMC